MLKIESASMYTAKPMSFCDSDILGTAVMGFLVRCSLEVKAKSNNCC